MNFDFIYILFLLKNFILYYLHHFKALLLITYYYSLSSGIFDFRLTNILE